MARRIKERKLKNPAITIIGEGATERFYFTHLQRLITDRDAEGLRTYLSHLRTLLHPY